MAEKNLLGIIRKFAMLALSILCIAPLVSSALIFPKVIRVMILDYLEGVLVAKLPNDAQIAVYNGGLIYWSNNRLHLRRFGEPRYHIYRSYDLDKIARRANVDSNMVPLLGSINGDRSKRVEVSYLAVSNDGRTVAVKPSGFGNITHVIRNGEH